MDRAKVDKRIQAMVEKKAGEKINDVVKIAQELITSQGKKPERALADALEILKIK